MTVVEQRASRHVVARPIDDELGHIWCCVDDTVGLCGAGLTGPAGPDTPRCVVCVDLEEHDYDRCPVLGRCIG